MKITTPFNIQLTFTCAPILSRIGAWIIDLIILSLYAITLQFIFEKLIGINTSFESGLYALFISIPVLVYDLFFELFWRGQSLGKKICNIQVLTLEGEIATFSQLLIRWLFRFIDLGFLMGCVLLFYSQILFGFLLIIGCVTSTVFYFTTMPHQRLGDIIAGTTVVIKKLPYSIHNTIFKEIDTENYEVQFPQVMNLSDKDINTIDNVLNFYYKYHNENQIENMALRIKSALSITTNIPDDSFLENLLRDYNYLSRSAR